MPYPRHAVGMRFLVVKNMYSLTLKKHIFWHGIYDDKEMDFFDSLKRDVPSYTQRQALEIFPEAKSVVREIMKTEIEQCRKDLDLALRIESECHNIIYRKSSKESEYFWQSVCDVLWVQPLREGREQKIKRNSFFLSNKPKGNLNVERAKEFPIDELIEFRKNIGKCLWCDDCDGDDLYYYRKTNRVYCFACNKSADSIDVCMKLTGFSFVDAVKKLT